MSVILIYVTCEDEKEALKTLEELINDGLDAKNFLNDILEVLYLFGRRINLGRIEKDLSISEAEVKMIDEYSQNIDMQDIGLFWQLTLKTIDDLRIVGNENLTLEMYVMQMTHLKNIDKKNENDYSFDNQENLVINKLKDKSSDENFQNESKDQLKSTNQIKTKHINDFENKKEKIDFNITSFKDLIQKANDEKEIQLKYDLERNVKLVSFNKGKIDISFNENLNKNFIKSLTEKLLLWTGERWIISLSKNKDAKSVYEKNLENKNDRIEKFNKTEIADEILSAFPDAKLIDVTEKE